MKKIFSIILLSAITILILNGCKKENILKQTDEFYVNDNARTLLSSTKWTIIDYGEELYTDSSQEEFEEAKISGSQVVIVTYEGNVGDINTTEIFNSWGIGKNDMGILIVMFFDRVNDELVYKELIFEIGDKMSGYLSAFEATNLTTEYFNELDTTDYDLKIISLYFKILEIIYLRVYNYGSYNYQSYMDEYLENQYEYFPNIPSEETNFFDSIPLWLWIVIIIFVISTGSFRWLLPFVFTGGRSRNLGGGGRSRGYWFRK